MAMQNLSDEGLRLAETRAALTRAEIRIARLEKAIRRVLGDAETGRGWGPDVTAERYLQEALHG